MIHLSEKAELQKKISELDDEIRRRDMAHRQELARLTDQSKTIAEL